MERTRCAECNFEPDWFDIGFDVGRGWCEQRKASVDWDSNDRFIVGDIVDEPCEEFTPRQTD